MRTVVQQSIIRYPDVEIQYKQNMKIYIYMCVYVYMRVYINIHIYIHKTPEISYFFTAALYNALPSQRDLPLFD